MFNSETVCPSAKVTVSGVKVMSSFSIPERLEALMFIIASPAAKSVLMTETLKSVPSVKFPEGCSSEKVPFRISSSSRSIFSF